MSAIAPRRHVLSLVLSCLLAIAGQPVRAATTPPTKTFAVVSLIGDEFSVVMRRDETPSRLDGNERRVVPVPDATFDTMAAAAAEQAMETARPGVPVLRASIRDPRLFALQDKLTVESADSAAMRAALHDLLVKAGATDLILITKRRDEASFRVVGGKIGSGMISGLGFYVDSQTRMQNVDRRDGSAGFLSPYAYLTVSLIDVASMTLVKSKIALESSMTLAVDKAGADKAWDALSGKEKVDALERAIRRAVTTGTAAVLAE